jgi:hypothetical protein
MAIESPVAFIVFNRPDLTERVFQSIRQAQPRRLLVIADGPRVDRPGEAEKCAAVRAVIGQIDWECEVLTNYSETNLGCKQRVSSGLDWVFSQVEEAIILEDDCLPAPSFFPFCQELLEKYREDDRVSMICGTNYQQGNSRTGDSYYFSKYVHVWGWAGWRRAWKDYDVEIQTWPDCKAQNLLRSTFCNEYEQKLWIDAFDRVHSGGLDTWDYQWVYACLSQHRLSIVPDRNLISNIGFGTDATHTYMESPWGNLPRQDIWEIQHPALMARNYEADLYTLNEHYGHNMVRDQMLMARIKRRLLAVKRFLPMFS